MGGDFTYQDANVYYKNLDKLIRYLVLAKSQCVLKTLFIFININMYINCSIVK